MNSPHPFFAAAFSLAFVSGGARAQSEASALDELATLPIASVATEPQAAGACAAVPGAVSVVKSVEESAYAVAYTLEGVSDRARIRIEIAGRDARRASVVAGMIVTATPTRTGTVLATAGEPIAFIPNALGRAVLDGRRTTA